MYPFNFNGQMAPSAVKMSKWPYRNQMKGDFYMCMSRSRDTSKLHSWGILFYGKYRNSFSLSSLLRKTWPTTPFVTLYVRPNVAVRRRSITMENSAARLRNFAPSWSSGDLKDSQESRNVTEMSTDCVLGWEHHLLMVNISYYAVFQYKVPVMWSCVDYQKVFIFLTVK